MLAYLQTWLHTLLSCPPFLLPTPHRLAGLMLSDDYLLLLILAVFLPISYPYTNIKRQVTILTDVR